MLQKGLNINCKQQLVQNNFIKKYFLLFLVDEIECFVDGECTQSLFVGQYSAVDAQECLDICKDHEGCQYFTYFGQDDTCVNFANCEVLDDKDCEECYSGNRTCSGIFALLLSRFFIKYYLKGS